MMVILARNGLIAFNGHCSKKNKMHYDINQQSDKGAQK